jgi:MerR family transcriptional regulator, light-induced transcriptional regulator
MNEQGKLVPIRTVCAMYGINPNTLRTWERRYDIVEPQVTAGGHRAYGPRDVEAIGMMVRLVGEGRSPATAAAQVRQASLRRVQREIKGLARFLRDLREAITGIDSVAAVETAHSAVRGLGYEAAVEQVLFPELAHWGVRWDQESGGIAREHLASLVTRAIILERQLELISAAAGPAVTLACAPGEAHDLPLLHAANYVYASREFMPVLLVAGLPVEHIIDASRLAGSIAIVLSATIEPQPSATREWLGQLIQAGWEETLILVGSGFAHSRVFSETRVKAAPGEYAGLVEALRKLNA